MCERAVTEAVEIEEQPDGRIAYWHYVEDEGRYLKVVVEPDGEEIVTAHFGRGFGKSVERRRR